MLTRSGAKLLDFGLARPGEAKTTSGSGFLSTDPRPAPHGAGYDRGRADGPELYYRAANASLMAVPIEKGAVFIPGTPQPLFRARFAPVTARGLYRPTPDGQRFLILAPLGRDAMQPATVVLNWTSALP
jgi:hypothetical protein